MVPDAQEGDQVGHEALREQLLQVMEAKDHWAWPHFAEGRIPLSRLLPHFQREWAVYVRDFPVLLARVLAHGPPEPVRRALASNLYEEQTGGISRAAPHPELFLRMMEGCGFSRDAFEQVRLPPAATAYRAFLDRSGWEAPWVRGAAVLTLFVEGSAGERLALKEQASLSRRSEAEIEAVVARHPLVRLHGVSPAAMELVRVHQRIEGGHREDAWAGVLEAVTTAQEPLVLAAMREALERWLAYRDEVAAACGI